MRKRQSLVNFVILIIFALSATIFVLKKAEEAIDEINALSNMPAHLPVREDVKQ